MDVGAWLRGLGLHQYEQTFREHAIELEVLPDLGETHLRELGIPLGHRLKLLKAISQLRPGDETPAPGPAGPDPAAGGERRQVTVLFADLSDYTALSRELDPEELQVLTDRFFDVVDAVIERYGGTVDKHIGDCVMAVFGAPVAHGNDPERAVRAALEIRRRIAELHVLPDRPLGVHIGIASGQVLASVAGTSVHRAYTVTGESVNLASRLTDEAGTGEILISDAVHRELAHHLDCTRAGALRVKGFARPVPAWRLLDLREAREPGERRVFVGRRPELQQFRALLATCRRSGRGRAVHVRGEAGIGKTRLAEEFLREAARRGFDTHTSLVLDFGTGAEASAVRALVCGLLRLAPAEAARTAAVAAAAARALAAGLVSAERRVHLNELLQLSQPLELRALYDALDSGARTQGARDTLTELAARASRERPLVLAVEDVHWADRTTLDHLAALAECAASHPLLLVMTARIEGDPLDEAWRARLGRSPLVTIDLGPLGVDEARVLAGAYFNARTELAQRCLERAAGNPLFLEQLLRHAGEDAGAGVPASVQSLVQARMDRLTPADKRGLQAAAALGQQFELAALRALLDDPAYDPGELVRHRLVRPHAGGLLFAHALIRDGVYDSLLKARRRELHRRAAAWFAGQDLALVALHLERAEDEGAGRAYLEAAAAEARAYRYDRALRLLERALALPGSGGEEGELRVLRGELLHHQGDVPGAIAAWEEALARTMSERLRCRALIGLADAMRTVDRLDDAFAMLEEAEAIGTRLGLAAELARLHGLRGNLCFPQGRLEECLAEHEKALALARTAGSVELEAQALGGLADADYASGRMLSARARFESCVALASAHGFGRIEVANRPMAAITLVYAQEFEAAIAQAQTAIDGAARVGHLRAEMIARHAAFLAHAARGEIGPARAHTDRALDLARQLGARRFEAEALGFLGDLARMAGDRPAAERLLEEAISISRRSGFAFIGPMLLGSYALATDDAKRRSAALEEAERLLAAGSLSHNHLLFYAAGMETSLERGEWPRVRRYADALERYTAAEPLPWATFLIERARALCAHTAGADAGPALARLRERALQGGHRIALPALESALTDRAGPPIRTADPIGCAGMPARSGAPARPGAQKT